MIRTLTDTKRAVMETIRMRLSEKEALLYLQGTGHPMARRTYYKHKAELESKKLERLHFIAMIGFQDQHLERIDTCETILKLMWKDYHLCKNPKDRVMILKEIKELQPYISSYYDTTRSVIEKSARQTSASVPNDSEPIPDIE